MVLGDVAGAEADGAADVDSVGGLYVGDLWGLIEVILKANSVGFDRFKFAEMIISDERVEMEPFEFGTFHGVVGRLGFVLSIPEVAL